LIKIFDRANQVSLAIGEISHHFFLDLF